MSAPPAPLPVRANEDVAARKNRNQLDKRARQAFQKAHPSWVYELVDGTWRWRNTAAPVVVPSVPLAPVAPAPAPVVVIQPAPAPAAAPAPASRVIILEDEDEAEEVAAPSPVPPATPGSVAERPILPSSQKRKDKRHAAAAAKRAAAAVAARQAAPAPAPAPVVVAPPAAAVPAAPGLVVVEDVPPSSALERAQTEKLLAEAEELRARARAHDRGHAVGGGGGGGVGSADMMALIAALLGRGRGVGAGPAEMGGGGAPPPVSVAAPAEVVPAAGASPEGVAMETVNTLRLLPADTFVKRFAEMSEEWDGLKPAERKEEGVKREGYNSDALVNEYDGLRFRALGVAVYAQRKTVRVHQLDAARWAMLQRPVEELLAVHPEWRNTEPRVPWEQLEERDAGARRGHLTGGQSRVRYSLTGVALDSYIGTLSSCLRYMVKHLLGRDLDPSRDVDPSVILDFPVDIQGAFDGWVASVASEAVEAARAKQEKTGERQDVTHRHSKDGNNVMQALGLMWYPHSEHLAPITRMVTAAYNLKKHNMGRDRARQVKGELYSYNRKNMVDWDVLRAANGAEADRVIAAYRAGTATNSDVQAALMTSLMTDLPPIRNNYGRMSLIDHRPTPAEAAALPSHDNVLYRDGGKYYRLMRSFKNQRSLGDQTLEVDVPATLGNSTRVSRLLDIRVEAQTGGMSGGYLFVSLGKWARTIAAPASVPRDLPPLGRATGELLVSATRNNLDDEQKHKKVNFQVYRVSHDTAVIRTLDVDDFVTLARLMMHSETVAASYIKVLREEPDATPARRQELRTELTSKWYSEEGTGDDDDEEAPPAAAAAAGRSIPTDAVLRAEAEGMTASTLRAQLGDKPKRGLTGPKEAESLRERYIAKRKADLTRAALASAVTAAAASRPKRKRAAPARRAPEESDSDSESDYKEEKPKRKRGPPAPPAASARPQRGRRGAIVI